MNAPVIIIDDDERFGKTLKAACELKGIKALWIARADEAKGVVQAIRPYVVVLDVMMPGEHGLTILDEMQKDPALKGMIVILASNFDKAAPIARSKGVEFWAKNDMSLDMMAARISELLSVNYHWRRSYGQEKNIDH